MAQAHEPPDTTPPPPELPDEDEGAGAGAELCGGPGADCVCVWGWVWVWVWDGFGTDGGSWGTAEDEAFAPDAAFPAPVAVSV
jgi:hypothetical protein